MASSAVRFFDLQTDDASKLLALCEEVGCFRLLNHEIPSSLMSDMKSLVASLFELPVEVKRRNADVITTSGYMLPTATNPLYESFGLYDITSPQGIQRFCTQLNTSPHQM